MHGQQSIYKKKVILFMYS